MINKIERSKICKKNLWILKTIPVKEKTIYDAKIIANYIFALPAYIVSILVLLITSRFSNVLDYIVVILLPLVGLSFSVIIGLKTNLYNPNLNWNNEVEAVKRSKSVAFLMFKVMLVLALVSIPSVILSIVLETSLYSDIFLLVAMIVIGLITFFGYKKVANYKLNSIE